MESTCQSLLLITTFRPLTFSVVIDTFELEIVSLSFLFVLCVLLLFTFYLPSYGLLKISLLYVDLYIVGFG